MSQARSQPPRFDSLAAFDAWAEAQDGKWELHDGIPVGMAPERLDHSRLKTQAGFALQGALRRGGLPCEAFIDGPLIPGPGLRRFQPDVIVACGEELDGNALVVERPIILVEVTSPSTSRTDHGLKLASYFALPSVQHYLIIDSFETLIIHHRRWEGDKVLTTLHRTGPIDLDPPGISLDVETIYP